MNPPRKGVRGTLRRVSVLPHRYGVGSARIRRRLRGMVDLLRHVDMTPTIPITARTLERHPEIHSELRDVDSAVHGYHHVAYTGMTASAQRRDLQEAIRVFVRHGLPTTGFRAPYLAADETTRHVLLQSGFLYDSSVPRILSVSGDPFWQKARRLAETRYPAALLGSTQITVANGLVEIPVSLPDDEILVDGLAITNSETFIRVLDRMLDAACEERSALVLQIHPERFPLFAEALKHVSKKAADKGAWRAPLSEIAHRLVRSGDMPGSSFIFAVTGDLDAVTVLDFASRLWEGG